MLGYVTFLISLFIHFVLEIPIATHEVVQLPTKLVGDYLIVYIDIVVAIIISFVEAVVWILGYGIYRDTRAQIKSGSTGGKYTLTYTNGTEDENLDGTSNGTLTVTKDGTTYTITKADGGTLNTSDVSTTTPSDILIKYGHVHAEGFSGTGAKLAMIGPLLIVLVGMGLVYAIYPGIAPGIVSLLRKYKPSLSHE